MDQPRAFLADRQATYLDQNAVSRLRCAAQDAVLWELLQDAPPEILNVRPIGTDPRLLTALLLAIGCCRRVDSFGCAALPI